MKYCPFDGKKLKKEVVEENKIYRVIIYMCTPECGCSIKRITTQEKDNLHFYSYKREYLNVKTPS